MLTKYFDGKFVLAAQIDEPPASDLALVIVIPAMNEPGLLHSLQALLDCDVVDGSIEVITVINHVEGASREIVEMNHRTIDEAREWAKRNSRAGMRFHMLFHPDLPSKKGGVGMARKIGMDEAARRLVASGNPEGVISCFDADCQCAPDYAFTLLDFFRKHADVEGVSIHFEHPLAKLATDVRTAIIQYELHLRYFIDAQRVADFPFAYQTVGSSMAIRASVYIKVGGMNTRKAGEDFYFLHKVIERGAHHDLTTTAVYPSARGSDRVPFGTGKAVTDLLHGTLPKTYNPRSFEDLRIFIAIVPSFFTALQPVTLISKLPDSIKDFLETQKFKTVLSEIKTNTASRGSFEKRFFRWFNAFRLMKYVHFARDHYYPDVAIEEAVDWLFVELGIDAEDSTEKRLIHLRKYDKVSDKLTDF